MSKNTHQFQAEIKQLLDLMVHSLYSQREIFLRELISNASDAIDKLQFLSRTEHDLVPTGTEFQIRLQPDSEKHVLKIIDNGVGMTQAEVIDHIGTIAQSGTKKFAQMGEELKNRPELIGQFGVGFYSAFMVADRVILHTQKAGSHEGTLWESTGDGTYSIDQVPRPEGTGTTITLFLKEAKDEDAQNFSDPEVLKDLVRKHSDFISHPIKMKEKVSEKKEDGTTTETETDLTLNTQKALWQKPAAQVTPEEYSEFYRHVTHDWQAPLKALHFKAEGTMEYYALLFIPEVKPFNYYMKEAEVGLNLYVKRVLIMNECEDLIPPYLRFVKGVVDSSDLSLNISREMLQQDKQVGQIRKSLVSKVLNSLKELLTKERATYEKFWNEFGATLKEGIPGDPTQKEKLQDLLLLQSSASSGLTTLAEYVSRMKPEQKDIYYISGNSLAQVQNSPYLERLQEKGYEVLYLVEAVDDFVLDSLLEYQGKKLQSVAKETLDLDTEEEKKAKDAQKKDQESKFKPLMDFFTKTLVDDIKEVRLSDRLKQTPVCLVSGAYDPTVNMEKLMAQLSKSGPVKRKRILEINPEHAVFEKMLALPENEQKKWAEILYAQALLNEGSTLPDPGKFSRAVSDLMIHAQI